MALAASFTFALSGCSSSYPNVAGVWKASDGTPNKTISDDGNCTNLMYHAGHMFTTDNPGMCHIIATAPGGAYVFQVVQKPYSVKYTARFSHNDKTISLSRGGKHFVTLTEVPSAH